MTYVLGTATATNAPFRLQYTVANDTLATLAGAYGLSALAIFQAQPGQAGKTMTRKTVQAWVKSLAGHRVLPFVASDNPGTVGADGKPEGYAVLTADTQIMLPDMPRLDGKKPRSTLPDIPPPAGEREPPAPEQASFDMWWLVGLGVLGAVGALAFAGARREKRPSA